MNGIGLAFAISYILRQFSVAIISRRKEISKRSNQKSYEKVIKTKEEEEEKER